MSPEDYARYCRGGYVVGRINGRILALLTYLLVAVLILRCCVGCEREPIEYECFRCEGQETRLQEAYRVCVETKRHPQRWYYPEQAACLYDAKVIACPIGLCKAEQ